MAAALACLRELANRRAIERMDEIGMALRRGLDAQANDHDVEIRQSGPPAIPFLTFVADRGKFARSRRFAAECARGGIYFHPHHNWFLSAAHGTADVRATLEVTDRAFSQVKRDF